MALKNVLKNIPKSVLRAGMRKEDRYLKKRGNRYWYVRGVPRDVQLLDRRAPLLQQTLRTSSIHTAREKRDGLEVADNELWDALRSGIDAATARQRYDASVKLHSALRFKMMTPEQLLADANDPAHYGAGGEIKSLPEVLRRPAEAIRRGADVAGSEEIQSLLAGDVPKPEMTVREAFDDYIADLCASAWLSKSDGQRAMSTKPKRRAIENFIKVVGDKAIMEIDRDDAVRFRSHWQRRMAAREVDYSTANRDLDNMRVLWRWHNQRIYNTEDSRTPFDGLNFDKPRKKKNRPAYSPEFVRDNFLHGDKLASMKPDIRRALLVIIGTGCRPSEVNNVKPENIVLDAPVPHLRLRDENDRELKNSQSNRDVPLVGFALAAMRAHVADGNMDGFPRYRDKDTNFSNAMKAAFKRKGLRQTPDHSLYSMRHMFENLMRDADIGDDMRRELMGHKIDRPKYGDAFRLAKTAAALEKVLEPLTYDPAVI
jgi:integrase